MVFVTFHQRFWNCDPSHLWWRLRHYSYICCSSLGPRRQWWLEQAYHPRSIGALCILQVVIHGLLPRLWDLLSLGIHSQDLYQTSLKSPWFRWKSILYSSHHLPQDLPRASQRIGTLHQEALFCGQHRWLQIVTLQNSICLHAQPNISHWHWRQEAADQTHPWLAHKAPHHTYQCIPP